ncbi:MAG: foldase protein PrsA [Planctomycetota bacterium]
MSPHQTLPFLLSLASLALAQDPPAPAAPTPGPAGVLSPPEGAEKPRFVQLVWPRDRDAVVAVVADRKVTLDQVAQHIEERHQPRFREYLATVEGQRLLSSDLVAPWVRQHADIMALREEAKARKLDLETAEPLLAEALKAGFESWLAIYTDDLAAQGVSTELSQQRINRLLSDWQLKNGLGAELQGMLDFLTREEATVAQLREFFVDNARSFGGKVTMAHILVQHRDAGTGILLREDLRAAAFARMADVKARLRPDGSNFPELAKMLSEDTRTAPSGGVLSGVERYDQRLPAVLCRTAWTLRDGEVSDVVESQYGLHVVLRVKFDQQRFMLFTDAAIPMVRLFHHRDLQERTLFGAREKYRVTLQL